MLPVSQSYSWQRSFADIDDLAAEARHWDLDFRQLDRGDFSGELLQFGVGGVHVSDAFFGRTINQKGSPPAGLRTIAVPANNDLQLVWRGQQVTGSDLMVFPSGDDLSSVSRPGFHVFTCSFPDHLLSALCEEAGWQELDALRKSNEVIRCDTATIGNLRKHLHQHSRMIRQDGCQLDSPGSVDYLTRELPMRLLSAISTSSHSDCQVTTRRRERGLTRAELFIEEHAAENIRVTDIVRAAKISQRSLEYAFVERFGLTPQAFLKVYRLNAVRRGLRLANPSRQRVADLASIWGFWHMGQFAADYRKQFGELPSETFQRANGRNGSDATVDTDHTQLIGGNGN